MKKSLVLVLALSMAPLCAMEKNKMFGLGWALYVGDKDEPVSSPNYFTSKSLRNIRRGVLPNFALSESPIQKSELNTINDVPLSPITKQPLFKHNLDYSDPLKHSFNQSGSYEDPFDELSVLSPIKGNNNSTLNNSLYDSYYDSYNESTTITEQPTGIIVQEPSFDEESLLNMTHLNEIQHVSIFDMNDTKEQSLCMNGLNQDPSFDLSASFNNENMVLVFNISGNTFITKPFKKKTGIAAATVLRQKNPEQNMGNLLKLLNK